MKKQVKTSLLVLIIAFAIFTTIQVKNAYANTEASIVGTSTINTATLSTFERKCFYAYPLWWVFYADGTNFVYCTSADGMTWSSPSTIRSGASSGAHFSVWYDGANFHYAYAQSTDIYYRKGIPETDGTVNWFDSEQTVPTVGTQGYYPCVTMDSNGYAWIAYMDDADGFIYVVRSQYNNGTWGTTPVGFPYNASSFSDLNSKATILRLNSGKMMLAYACTDYTVRSQIWNGTSWEAEKATTSTIQSSSFFSAVAIGDDVHLAFLKRTIHDVIYVNFSFAENIWGAETTLASSLSTTSAPVLCKDSSDLTCFWANSNHIYYKQYINGIWDSSATDWISETAITGNEKLTCFYAATNGRIGLIYSNSSSSPYEVMFASILRSYTLAVTSFPLNISFTIFTLSLSTPYSDIIINGTYEVIFTSSFVRSGLTWTFSYWDDNTSNTNPIRTIDLQSNSSYSVTYTSVYAPLTYTGFGPVFECAMNNMFELDSITESMIGNVQRQMLLDSSPYGNHGHMYPITSPYGGPTLTWGAMGKGLRLDGIDDTVIVPSSSSLNISEAITVEFWFSVDNGTANQIIVSKPYEWHIAIINHTLYAGVYTTGGNYWIESNTTLPDGAFGFVSFVYDYRYANASLYINSELDSSVATDGNPISLQNSDLYLGSYGNASSYFKGVLDEIRIFPYQRSEEAIYSDARAAITKFDSLNFVASSKQVNLGTEEISTEGVIDGYTGLTTNDWQLPWAYANETYQHTAIRAASYMAGFQSYQLYCNVKFTYDLGQSSTWNRCFVDWYWLFFRDGKLQVAFIMEVSPETIDVDNVTEWHVRFVRTTSYYANVTMLEYTFSTNTTLYPHTIPIIVSAWVGPDNEHFTIRFDVQDSRMITAYDGSYITPFVYSFLLVDENVNPHLVAWFDGWVVSGIKVLANSASGPPFYVLWEKMEIESHKFFWIPIVLAAILVFGFAMVYYSKPTDLLVPVQIIHEIVTKEIITVLQPLAEIIGAAVKGIGEPIVDALSLLSHDIIGAVFGLGTVFLQGLSPIGDLLLALGGSFVSALLGSIGLIWDTFLSVIADAWAQYIVLEDAWFSYLGYPNGFSILTGWLGGAWGWMLSSMSYSLSFVAPFFTFLATFMAQLISFIAEAFQWWGAIFTATGSFLAGGYGTGVNIWTTYNIPQWITLGLILYPIYLVFLWEEEGLGAVIDQITFIYNTLHLMIYVFLTMIHYVSSMVTRLIEMIPIAE